jgi:hypothetical protein
MKRMIVIKDAESATPSARLWKTRVALTFLCAIAADSLQWLIPFLWPVCDGAMVFATLVLWGWRWEVIMALIPELIPGIELAPTWTLFAAYLFVIPRKGGPSGSQGPREEAESRGSRA